MAKVDEKSQCLTTKLLDMKKITTYANGIIRVENSFSILYFNMQCKKQGLNALNTKYIKVVNNHYTTEFFID